jgi:hypothetical protein
MVGKVFITSTGYDPELGKHVKDPYLGPKPTLGACRPDIRRILQVGDHVFVISGKIKTAKQFLMGGFQIAEKITALEAYERFPGLRLRMLENGEVDGNIIVNAEGKQHELDHHKNFKHRITNYVVGTNPTMLATSAEMAQGRIHTLDLLQDVFQKKGSSPREIMGRCSNLSEKQIQKLLAFLHEVKNAARQRRSMNDSHNDTDAGRQVS